MSGESSAGRKACIVSMFLYQVMNISVVTVYKCVEW
jgi:hypothetical protein